MLTRRDFLKASAYAGGSLILLRGAALRPAWAAIPGGSLDPTAVPKYVTPLVIPPVMPRAATLQAGAIDSYRIAVRQFRQQILPPSLPTTTVWGYGVPGRAGTFNYPAFTIEAKADRPVRVTWINQLMDGSGHYLPHLLPVDPTLHWANPSGGVSGRDMRPMEFPDGNGPYRGPVPISVHLHGGHTSEESDGHPEAWWLPPATDIPSGYATVGSMYEEFAEEFADKTGATAAPGSAIFHYENDQRASTLWFHDHSLGMTRLNVYVGPAGFYLLRGGPADFPRRAARSGAAAGGRAGDEPRSWEP
jgi:spore coat protein A